MSGTESRRWIVDASNVYGSRPDGWWRDRPGALARLVDEVLRWRDEVGQPVAVVADGHPSPGLPEGTRYGVEVVYAHSSRSDAADDAIVDLVAGDEAPAEVVVVTSDRALRQRVTALGAGTEGAGRFLERLADIPSRRSDRAVLAHFGVDEGALLGRGGEARVFALDADRVLRLPHPGTEVAALEGRRRLLEAIATPAWAADLPQVLAVEQVEGRTVLIERRLPGRPGLEVLARPGADRGALVRNHLEVAHRIAELACPTDEFGEVMALDHSVRAPTFEGWAVARLSASLARAGRAFAHVDPHRLTADLLAALPDPGPDRPVLVHGDVYLGNLLVTATGDRVTAVLDFGPLCFGGVAGLDALFAIAYLAPEITPPASDDDRRVARQWAADAGLEAAVTPAERWIAAFWSAATDDESLRRWSSRILAG